MEVYGLERTAYKNMAYENDLYNTITAIHNGYFPNNLRKNCLFFTLL